MSSETGPSVDTAAGDVVSIVVSPDPPYGVQFEPDMDGNAAVIKSFEKLPSGKFGPIQKHGGVHYGDVLFAINETQLDVLSFSETLLLVQDRNILRKTFRFMNSREYYRKRRGGPANIALATESSKSSFLSSIRRYRTSVDTSNRKFVEYEIACQLRVPGSRIQKDIVHKWSVYKRYSEFEKLNVALKASLGWQIEGIDFPPPYTFSMNKLSPEFIEQRRDELNRYWQKIISIDRVCDFVKHHSSSEIKQFLDVEETMKTSKLTTPEAIEPPDEAKIEEEEKKTQGSRKTVHRTQSIRRRSMNSSLMSLESPEISIEPQVESPALTNVSVSPVVVSSVPPPPPPPPKAFNENEQNHARPQGNSVRINLLSEISSLRKDE